MSLRGFSQVTEQENTEAGGYIKLLSGEIEQKKEVHQRMKTLLSVLFSLGPSPSYDFPMVELLYDPNNAIGIPTASSLALCLYYV